jgi:thiamine-monophosphate kinase
MRISDMVEREIVEIFKNAPYEDERVVVGPGDDDCAIVNIGGNYLAITTDMVHETTDFPTGMTPEEIGFMAIAVNLSDLASCGADPAFCLLSAGLPGELEKEILERIVDGVLECLQRYRVALIGGDVDYHEELTLSATGIGIFPEGRFLTRKGAEVGDYVYVTGPLGAAEYILERLRNNETREEINNIELLFKPTPKIQEGRDILASGVGKCMTDISDSLAVSLYDLSRASNVGFEIYKDRLPIFEEAVSFYGKERAIELSLYGGGDFQLLFTSERRDLRYPCIGKVVAEGIYLVDECGGREQIIEKGYSHFR